MLLVFVQAFKLENTFRHKLLYTYKHDSVQPDKSLALINYENVLYIQLCKSTASWISTSDSLSVSQDSPTGITNRPTKALIQLIFNPRHALQPK